MSLMINHVWFGNNSVGPLERFNIYSWMAMGHSVTIYAHHWNGEHSAKTLGLMEDVRVFNLKPLLSEDCSVTDENDPRKHLPMTRELLLTWLNGVKGDSKPSMELIYNLVDTTKSYIGATRRGIVLDLKVGPSQHLKEYIDCFGSKFISYSRGGNTPSGMPENQCMGTNQEEHKLRLIYAKKFESQLSNNFKGYQLEPNTKWCDNLTRFHGLAFQSAKGIDVALATPANTPHEKVDFKLRMRVDEIGETNHGPFRVFKKSTDQSNKAGSVKTTALDVYKLCEFVLKKQLNPTISNLDVKYFNEVKKAFDDLPKS